MKQPHPLSRDRIKTAVREVEGGFELAIYVPFVRLPARLEGNRFHFFADDRSLDRKFQFGRFRRKPRLHIEMYYDINDVELEAFRRQEALKAIRRDSPILI